MSSGTATAEPRGSGGFRVWTLIPLALLAVDVLAFAASGDSLTGLVRDNQPAADEFDIRRVEFHTGEIRVRVTNPQPDDLTIATVTVDDAIVPYTVDGPQTLGRLRSSTIEIPYEWVQDEPISVGVTSSTGIQTTEEIAAAVETPEASGRSFLGYGLIGILVGVIPVALGLLWLPSLRRAAPQWLAAFMALTGGLLTFLALEALSEALELQAVLPGPLGGPGLVLLGASFSYLALTFLSQRFAAGEYVVQVGTLAGTNDGDLVLSKRKATGKPVKASYLEIAHYEDGKVEKGWVFANGLAFTTQLGLE